MSPTYLSITRLFPTDLVWNGKALCYNKTFLLLIHSSLLLTLVKHIIFHSIIFQLQISVPRFEGNRHCLLIKQGKDALRDYSWNAIILDHQSNHMGHGLSQYALPIVIQQGQCASVDKAQNILIVLLQRHVGFNWSKDSQVSNLNFNHDIFIFYLDKSDLRDNASFSAYHLNLVVRSWLIGQRLIWIIFLQPTVAKQDGVMWIRRKHTLPRFYSKRNVIANMIVSGGVYVRCLCNARVSTNALVMDIVVVDFVRWGEF